MFGPLFSKHQEIPPPSLSTATTFSFWLAIEFCKCLLVLWLKVHVSSWRILIKNCTGTKRLSFELSSVGSLTIRSTLLWGWKAERGNRNETNCFDGVNSRCSSLSCVCSIYHPFHLFGWSCQPHQAHHLRCVHCKSPSIPVDEVDKQQLLMYLYIYLFLY